MTRTLIAAAAGALLLTAPMVADANSKDRRRRAQRTHSVKPQPVEGRSAAKNTKATLERIRWYTSLEEVKAAAQKSGKMILWMQMVGEFDGGL